MEFLFLTARSDGNLENTTKTSAAQLLRTTAVCDASKLISISFYRITRLTASRRSFFLILKCAHSRNTVNFLKSLSPLTPRTALHSPPPLQSAPLVRRTSSINIHIPFDPVRHIF